MKKIFSQVQKVKSGTTQGTKTSQEIAGQLNSKPATKSSLSGTKLRTLP